MTLGSDEIERLADACETAAIHVDALAFCAVPPLSKRDAERIVMVETVSADADERGATGAVARALLDEVNSLGEDAAVQYFRKLYGYFAYSASFTETVKSVLDGWQARQPQHQALTTLRDHLNLPDDMRRMLEEDYHRVCCLVADAGNRVTPVGTGFLIDTDLVVTAQHVVDQVARRHGPEKVPQVLRAVFDFTSGALPSPLSKNENLQVANLHPAHWDVCHSDSYGRDAINLVPSPEDLVEHKRFLDFAVLRLDRGFGETRPSDDRSRKRGWFDVGALDDTLYLEDIQVAVPQHSAGMMRQHDIGRILRIFDCKTRIRYDLNAAQGASGAPCIVPGAGVIAMHNVAHELAGTHVENQAVRLDAILLAVGSTPGAAPPSARLAPWAVERGDGTIAPIIGRDSFMAWMLHALANPASTAMRNNRVFAVISAQDDAAGLDFTNDIAEEVLRNAGEERLVTLGGGTTLPQRLENFVMVLGQELGLSLSRLSAPPTRPGAHLPTGAEDGDKLERWSSEIVPRWFLGEIARSEIQPGGAPWRHAWISLLRDPAVPLSLEVTNFVSGLIESDLDGRSGAAIARRLRWIFLGRVPGFLADEDATTETIDPGNVTRDQLLATLTTANEARALGLDEAELAAIATRSARLVAALSTTVGSGSLEIAQEIVTAEIDGLIAPDDRVETG